MLNLPVHATEADIKERHRALSLLFHPDKQHDEKLKGYAKERFLDVQTAYESKTGCGFERTAKDADELYASSLRPVSEVC